MNPTIKIFWKFPGEGRILFNRLFDSLKNLSPNVYDPVKPSTLSYYNYMRLRNNIKKSGSRKKDDWFISPCYSSEQGFDYILSRRDFNFKHIALIKFDTAQYRFSSLSIPLIPYKDNPFVSPDILPQYAFLFANYLLNSFSFIDSFSISFIYPHIPIIDNVYVEPL